MKDWVFVLERVLSSGNLYLGPNGDWSNKPYFWLSLNDAVAAAKVSQYREDIEMLLFEERHRMSINEDGGKMLLDYSEGIQT